MKARALVVGALWVGIAAVVCSVPSCYGSNCSGSSETFGLEQAEGHLVSDTQWESNGYDEAWLPFPRQRIYHFDLHALGGRRPWQVIPYVSAHRDQDEAFANHVIAAGNIAEIANLRSDGVDVINDTCSDYYLRLTITALPLPPAPDAGP
jgi:hypothetical protein